MRGIPRAAPKSTLLFLSHAGEDAQAARDLATLIRGAGLDVWLDVEQLKPGDLWQREIAAALKKAQALILYVGRSGVARWVDFEVQIALDRSAKERKFRMIPVLGPGSDPEALPDFLKLFQWVDLRGPKPLMAKLKTMLARITGEAPERVTALPPERPPFLGLQNFDVADAVVFFGREKEVDELLGHLRRDNFLLVVGDSGCGKSSLVCAGLIPALARALPRWPRMGRFLARGNRARGGDPFRELAENLPDLDPASLLRAERIASNRRLLAEGADGLRDIVAASARAGQHTLLVVDQFEELFTQTADPTARRRFIDCLLRAAASGGSRPVHVVLTLRADFYARCWEHPDLPALVARNQYPVGRMRPEQLRALIEGPLSLAGAQAEAGLVEAILEEAGDRTRLACAGGARARPTVARPARRPRRRLDHAPGVREARPSRRRPPPPRQRGHGPSFGPTCAGPGEAHLRGPGSIRGRLRGHSAACSDRGTACGFR